ncbi:glycosyltransferase family 4 protein [Acetobacter okinawensis]|uniref:glycosyltransferase family 4 protein n=1 Tax=Acetobacter okinawensis TaxID=1076594 RepID=UPI00209CCD0D|nr:glycosyltransferase family 4 protein [Acetobacter okinawensis]MCP1213720.1 glycosyltransferase family 4 protein [Acetobacter okinawensis]
MPKLLYLISEDWFFCSHFMARALAAKEAGFDVVVLTRVGTHAHTIREHGIRVVPWPHDRKSLNPLHELKSIANVVRIYRQERPDIVHHIAIKPILHGTIAALLANIRHIVNAPVGMGYIFSSSDRRARLLRGPVSLALRLLLNPRRSQVIFENPDDLRHLTTNGTVRVQAARLIRGAGIDLSVFAATPEPDQVPEVVLPARMLWDKGVGDFVTAAQHLKAQGIQARFLLAGASDSSSFAAIPEDTLQTWAQSGAVEYLGFCSDMPALLARSAIVCLPSTYREGLPKVLLEALATGRPVVTTDVEGCRETVLPDVNGLLVPPRNPGRLAEALQKLLNNRPLRLAMGKAGRALAETEFSQEKINAETLKVYADFQGR